MNLDIVYVCDQKYLNLTEFSIASIARASTSHLTFHVFQSGCSRPLSCEINDYLRTQGHEAVCHTFDDSDVNLRLRLHPHISAATALKARAIEKIAASSDSIVYVDGDVLAMRSANFESQFDFRTTLAGVYDFVSYMPFDGQDLRQHTMRTGISPDYFNAGVIFVNGLRWRSNDMLLRFEQSIEQHDAHCPFRHDKNGNDPGDCRGADQCAFNIAAQSDWTPLDFRWNVQKPLRHTSLWKEAVLRHYTGHRKFLAFNFVNRDSAEFFLLKKIKKEAGLKLQKPLLFDLGMMFTADKFKYRSDTAAYNATIKSLAERSKRHLVEAGEA